MRISLALVGVEAWFGGDHAAVTDMVVLADRKGVDQVTVVDHLVMGDAVENYPFGKFAQRPDSPWLEPLVPRASRLSLGEGWTPLVALPDLAAVLGLERLAVQREDLNPSGSHKDRGAAFQLSRARAGSQRGDWLVISSSGNAALASAAYAAAAGLRLATCLSPETPPEKLALLARSGALVLLSHEAIALAGASVLR